MRQEMCPHSHINVDNVLHFPKTLLGIYYCQRITTSVILATERSNTGLQVIKMIRVTQLATNIQTIGT